VSFFWNPIERTMMAAAASRSHFESDYELTAASNIVDSNPRDSATSLSLGLKMIEGTADNFPPGLGGVDVDPVLSLVQAESDSHAGIVPTLPLPLPLLSLPVNVKHTSPATCAASSQGRSHSGNETNIASPDPSTTAANASTSSITNSNQSTSTNQSTGTISSTNSVSLRKHPPSFLNVSLNGTNTSTKPLTVGFHKPPPTHKTMGSTGAQLEPESPHQPEENDAHRTSFHAASPGQPSLVTARAKRSPAPQRNDAFAAIPTALPAGEDNGEEDLDKKPAAQPTTDAVMERAARGRGTGRRTAQDREARRQQIRERTCFESQLQGDPSTVRYSPVSRSKSPMTSSSAREPSATGRIASMPNGLEPAAARAPTTSCPLPWDNIAMAPGDGLASMPQREAIRGRRPDVGVAKEQNPTADAYEATPPGTEMDHSLKQRMRRENNQNMPSSIRPGAYKEIPGRGLVRNDTLRFSIMNSIQKRRQSFRNIFVGSRRHGLAANHGSSEQESNRQSLNNDNPPSGQQRFSLMAAMNESLRTRKSFPSVLVEEEEDDRRSYLGNISMRSLEVNTREGLCVARPVFHKEVSTLEALCIIPGDLAIAVALNEQIREQQNATSAHHLEQLSSGESRRGEELPSPSSHGKRTKARRVAQFARKIVQQPKMMLKHKPTFRTVKNLLTFRKGPNKSKKKSAHDKMVEGLSSSRLKGDTNEPQANMRRGAALRRNSW
jgi:hypothetical protein